MLQVLLVRDVTEFDQHRGHVRRLEHLKPADLSGCLCSRAAFFSSATQRAGELHREVLGLALRQIDQDIGDIVRLGGEVDARRSRRRGSRLRQGGRPRHRRRFPTACRSVAPCASPSPRGSASAWIETNSDGLARARNAHPLGERHEGVVAARHRDAILAGLLDLVAQQQREFEHDRLFHLAARRLGAGVDAAVAGIDARSAGAGRRSAWPARLPAGGLRAARRGCRARSRA